MITVSTWFDTWMKKQQLYLLRKLTYDDIHESTRWESFGSISRSSDSIISGGTSIGVINSGKYWNKFLSDKSNLRKTATLQLAIGITNTIARAGVARAGITAAGLVTLASGSVVSSEIRVPRSGEWLDILTGWGDDPEFVGSSVSIAIRDKFAGLFEKALGSKDAPIDYYSSAYNPADLAWDILTTHGDLDSEESSANVDIDYDSWLAWEKDCAEVNLSLSGKFTGQSIREALELIRALTNSDISVDGSGLITFLRRAKGAASDKEQSFDTTNATDFIVKLDSSKIVNYLEVFYGFQGISNLVTNGSMEATNSWADLGSPTTNERSNEQANSGTYSRKIVTDALFEGAYQDVTTIVGREYSLSGFAYVSAGDVELGALGTTFGKTTKGPTESALASGADGQIHYFAVTSGDAGTLESITVYVKCRGSTTKIKCALYGERDGSTADLVSNGTTDEKSLAGDFDGWLTFVFSTPPSVTAASAYHLMIWHDQPIYMYSGLAGTQKVGGKSTTYDGWPDPLTMTTYNDSSFYTISARYVFSVSSSSATTGWIQLSCSFTAVATTTSIFFRSSSIAASTFYVDDLTVKWKGPEFWPGSYIKEDATSQSNFGKAEPEVYQSAVIWHATLASATSFADRRIESFKDPLEIIQFTAFMEGQIAELGDIIKVTNSFFSYTNKYFRIYKILDINLAAASIRLEAADFDDIS